MSLSGFGILALIGFAAVTAANFFIRRAVASAGPDEEARLLLKERNDHFLDAAFFLYLGLVMSLSLVLHVRAWHEAHQAPYPLVAGLIEFGMCAAFGLFTGLAIGGAKGSHRRLTIARKKGSE